METVLLLFVLMMQANPEAKEQLRTFLTFYRENRELIAAIAGRTDPPPAQAPQTEEKERRSEGSGAKDVLEEYLKRCAV